MPKKKGSPKTGGRKKGTLNRIKKQDLWAKLNKLSADIQSLEARFEEKEWSWIEWIKDQNRRALEDCIAQFFRVPPLNPHLYRGTNMREER